MEELVRKIPIYHILNVFVPGMVFLFLFEATTSFTLLTDNVSQFVHLFFGYVIGFLINAVSKAVISPLLKIIRFIKYAPYNDYLEASKMDQDIRSMYETSDRYRTFGTVFLVLFILKVYEWFSGYIAEDSQFGATLFIAVMQCTFLFLHRRQTKFIVERINAQKHVHS